MEIMEFKMTRNDAEELRKEIRMVMFRETGAGKVMCAVYPSNGLYVADGMGRYVLEQNISCVDLTSYFEEMRMRDFFDLKASLGLKGKQTGGMI